MNSIASMSRLELFSMRSALTVFHGYRGKETLDEFIDMMANAKEPVNPQHARKISAKDITDRMGITDPNMIRLHQRAAELGLLTDLDAPSTFAIQLSKKYGLQTVASLYDSQVLTV